MHVMLNRLYTSIPLDGKVIQSEFQVPPYGFYITLFPSLCLQGLVTQQPATPDKCKIMLLK